MSLIVKQEARNVLSIFSATSERIFAASINKKHEMQNQTQTKLKLKKKSSLYKVILSLLDTFFLLCIISYTLFACAFV